MLKLIGEDILYNGIKVAQLVDAPSTVTGDFIDYLNLHEEEGLRDEVGMLEDKLSELEDKIEGIQGEKAELIDKIKDVLREYD